MGNALYGCEDSWLCFNPRFDILHIPGCVQPDYRLDPCRNFDISRRCPACRLCCHRRSILAIQAHT